MEQIGLPGQDEMGARLLRVAAAEMTFITVYCPNGRNVAHEEYGRKLSWFDTLSSYVRETLSPDRPIVLCGDFNICRSALDTWNEEELSGTIFHTDQERERLQSLLDWGFRDVFRERFPDQKSFSWWDFRGGGFHRNMGMRLDLILATDPIVSRMSSIEIDRDYRKKKDGMTASDHAPIFAELA